MKGKTDLGLVISNNNFSDPSFIALYVIAGLIISFWVFITIFIIIRKKRFNINNTKNDMKENNHNC